ncbi:BTB/POZ domain-containing protein 9-like isoform X2 [Drosophila obscura]|uniref:BTB/POZ domain-containing protein 9-like isoform X2 n=1 Tax=Drosophila obscura TaxID=7282 RepID=UPI001BB28E96|nr:BTB/POZ domain-containing protein 9-like isoform X2 [Drosophila obscura]
MNSHESLHSLAAKRRRMAQPQRVHKFGEGVLADIARLCMNDLYSDVSFFVEDQRISGHCAILATRCEYFRAMLFGGFTEERQIRLPEVPLEAFKVILGYLYSGTMSISTLDVDAILQVLSLANLYGLPELESVLTETLLENLEVCNVCAILDTARQYSMEDLNMKSLNFIDTNGAQVMEDDFFLMLSKESLEEVLRRDTFIAEELKIFQAVHKWSLHNPDVDIKSVVSLVRLPLIKVEDLVSTVRRSGIVDPNNIFDVIDKATKPENLPYRARQSPGVDVALWVTRSIVTKSLRNSTYILDCIVEISCDMTHWVNLGSFTFSIPTKMFVTFARRPVRFIRIKQLSRKNYFKDITISALLSTDT